MPSSGYRKQVVDFGDMALDLQNAAASFTRMSAAAAGFVSFVGAFKAFEQQIVHVNSAVGGSAKTFKQLSDAARNFALVSKYSAGEAASSMVMLAQAGFDAQEAMAAMPSVLQLAQASMENLDLVADTVASTIKTFNLSAQDSARITNLFAASAVNSLATVNKLAFSFRQVGPVAAELGLSVEETAAALDVLYNRGLRGEQAGTALRNILIRLIKPTEETYDTFYRLGIALKDSSGQLRNYQDILKDLGTSRVSDTALTKMFGREALAGAKTLIAATTGEYAKMLERISDTNTAARMANAQMNTMEGSLALIKNSLTELGIVIGESVGPYVRTLAGVIQNAALALRTADKETIGTIKHFAQLAGGLYVAEKAVVGLSSKLGVLDNIGKSLNRTFTASNLMGVLGLRNTIFSSGDIAGANLIKMWRAGQQGGSDWYSSINNVYQEITKGKNLSIEAAAQIKNLTKAQVIATATSLKFAAALKAIGASLKVTLVGLAKFSPIMLAAWGAFRLYDNWAKERERRAQIKEDLFPELTLMVDKLKEARLAVNRDLPDIAAAYKANMEAIAGGRRGITDAYGFFSHYGLTDSNIAKFRGMGVNSEKILRLTYYNRVDKFTDSLKKSILERQKLSAAEFYALGQEAGLDYNVITDFFEGYDKAFTESKYITFDDPISREDNITRFLRDFYRKRAEGVMDSVRVGTKELQEAVRKAREQNEQVFQKEIDLINKSLFFGTTEYTSSILTQQALSPNLSRGITDAYVRYLYGVPEGVDIAEWFKQNLDKARAAFETAKTENQNKLLKGFLDSPFFKNLSADAQSVIKTNVQIDAEGDLKVNAVDLNKQNEIVAQIRKQYADLLSDYRLSWDIVSQEEYAMERVAKLQREVAVNTASLATTIDTAFLDIFKKTGQIVFDASGAKATLEALNTETGEITNKQELLSKLTKNISLEERAYVILKLEELEQQTKIVALRNREFSMEEELYRVEKGRLAYANAYREVLSKNVELNDKFAENAIWSKDNLFYGLDSGIMEVANNIDNSYDMMKDGMQGFADYMSDSMYGVIDNWDKGWVSMRDSLRNTLADMLKDLAKYFAKMAAYQAAVGLGSALIGSAFSATGTRTPTSVTTNTATGVNTYTFASGAPSSIPSAPGLRPFSAKGSAWINGLQTFANGGVVTSPTLFNHKGGKGLMGEAGPEAIMPLKRDRAGNLGVSVTGGGASYSSTIIINAEQGTAKVTTDSGYDSLAKRLDSQIRGVVMSTLLREKKPGGMLA